MGTDEHWSRSGRARNIVNTSTWYWITWLRTMGSWVQVLPGAPFFKGFERKTKSSFVLWDPCGTSYPPVRVASTEFKHLARKTRCSFLAVGPCGTSHPHVRAGRRRRVTPSAYPFDREADSLVSVGGQRRRLRNDRPSNDWHGLAALRDLRRKRPPLATDTRTNGEDHGREPRAIPLRAVPAANHCCSSR